LRRQVGLAPTMGAGRRAGLVRWVSLTCPAALVDRAGLAHRVGLARRAGLVPRAGLALERVLLSLATNGLGQC
jgi:hypothetical protein